MTSNWADPDPKQSTERSIIAVIADLSGSMSQVFDHPDGRSIRRVDELESGLQTFVSKSTSADYSDDWSMHDVRDFDATAEIAIGTFRGEGDSPVNWLALPGDITSEPFRFGIGVSTIPALGTPGGNTPLGEAVIQALNTLESRRQAVRRIHGVTVRRPILFVLSDGLASTSRYRQAAEILKESSDAKRVLAFGFAVYSGDVASLKRMLPDSTYDLSSNPMSQVIEFLSTSMEKAMLSDPDTSDSDVYQRIEKDYILWQESNRSNHTRRIVP